MSDNFVTFRGWVGNEVGYRTPNGTSVANFRVGVTPRLRRRGDWVDGDTTWYSVNAWRSLAENVRDSIRKGDAVIVHGRLRSDNWTREDGQVSTTLVVDASFVGHDLTRGTTSFTRSTRPERTETDMDSEIQEMVHRPFDEADRPDPWADTNDAAEGTGALGPGAAA